MLLGRSRNPQKLPFLNFDNARFGVFNYISLVSAFFLLLSVVLFLHPKFAWGGSVSSAESILLQISYAVFSISVVFLLTGQSSQQRAKSVAEVLNSKNEVQ